ncbi:hypothetical protein ACROYT_G018266 [Oculina patagonica]
MAARDGNISDVELRRQLKALGEDVGPVTDTTRPFLFRKLKRLQNEQRSNKSSAEKPSPRRATSSGRRSLPATRNQTPSRKLIGFSSDEEDAEPRTSTRLADSSRLRGRRREDTTTANESPGREKSKPTTPRKSNLRPREPSFINSVPEETLDTTDANNELSDSAGQVYYRPNRRTIGITKYLRAVRRERDPDESERSDATLPSTSYDNSERSATANSELNPSLQERPAGAKHVKRSSFWYSTFKIALLISAICVVVLLCVTLKSHSSEKMISDLVKLPVCQSDNPPKKKNDPKPPDCIPLANISQGYAQLLFQQLIIKAGLFECEDPSTNSRNVTKGEFQKQIKEDNPSRKAGDQNKILNSTLQLILNNSNWNIRLFDKNNEVTTNATQVEWIDTSVSAKPMLCRIREALSRLAYLSFLIGFGIGGLMFAYFIVRQRWRREEEETRLMYQFVENIIDILREHHEASKAEKNLLPYLPIPHVRDMLIPPSDRQRLSKAWNRAVRFLSANESRIRVESQRIAGEDFEVWRWIHIATPKPHNPKLSLSASKHGKYWQGQAFENFQSAVNPPVISPTPCLKIRNMFDPDVETEDGWHVMIQDAILEKCIENGAGVVHIAVDKSSSEGCVYVKCDTHHSAGLAFRSLHGCWFDGRLVAVKYLTLKRYHQRFPVALEATERLNPSGSSPSSLVTFDPNEGEEEEDVNDSDVEYY